MENCTGMNKKGMAVATSLILPVLIICLSCQPGLDDPGPPEPEEPYVTTYFQDDFNNDDIDETVWQIATWTEHGGQTGRDRCYVSDGYLHLVFINDSTEGFLSAAIQSREEFYYGRWEARIKPSAEAGILNSFYTIDWNNTADESATDNGTKQEIDIEFLTYTFGENRGKVHFAVHEAGKESFETNPDMSLDFNPSEDFHTWGFEITQDSIEWFVDDQVLLTYTYSENPVVITAPYQLKLNVWSKEEWIHGPPSPDTECIYQIDWIKFTPNS
jgi:endo-1,3-1,4-beta-glycanase ExoK